MVAKKAAKKTAKKAKSVKVDEKEVAEKEIKPVKRVARSDTEFANSVVKIGAYKNTVSETERLKRKLEQQKVFANRAIEHFQAAVKEKNTLITNLNEETVILRQRTQIFETKLQKVEKLMDKLLLNHLQNEVLTEEDKFDQFVEDLKSIFN